MRMPAAAATLLGVMAVSGEAIAQTFTENTGTANPLSVVNNPSNFSYSHPALADLDNDGDLDFVTGSGVGAFYYYRNTGTKRSPAFVLVTGPTSPFNNLSTNGTSSPAFVDIDNDGDQDMFAGGYVGGANFYRNTGTAASPVFTLEASPIGIYDRIMLKAAFADLDNDGDFDVVTSSGDYYSSGFSLTYFRNTGTRNTPIFTAVTGAANPFQSIAVAENDTPSFADLDGDGDKDFVIGTIDQLNFYRNTGTATAPVFALQTGVNSPLPAV